MLFCDSPEKYFKPLEGFDIDELPTINETYTVLMGNLAKGMKDAHEAGRHKEIPRYHTLLDRTEEAMAFRVIGIRMQSDSFWENWYEE